MIAASETNIPMPFKIFNVFLFLFKVFIEQNNVKTPGNSIRKKSIAG
jgi:hypothetical protein